MKVEFSKAFDRDLRDLTEAERKRVGEIVQSVVNARSLAEVANVKKLKAVGNAFRIRIGEKRIGFYLEDSTVLFMRCLDRKEIYRDFP